MRRSDACVLVAAGLVVAGCAVNSPQETFYTLDAAITATAATGATPATRSTGSTAGIATTTATSARPGAAASAIVVFVEPARVPELLDRPQMIVSIGDAQVLPLEQQRWAEPLRAQIARVVALDLARVMPSARVSTNEDVLDGADPSQGYRVMLDVQRFETRPGEAAAIEVAWTVRRSANGVGGAGSTNSAAGASGADGTNSVSSTSVVASGRERIRESVTEPGYDAVVRAHNRALASVGRTIAAAIRPAAGIGN